MTGMKTNKEDLYANILTYVDDLLYTVNIVSGEVIFVSAKMKALLKESNEIFDYMNPCVPSPLCFLSEANNEMSIDMFCPLVHDKANMRFIFFKENDTPFATVIISTKKASEREYNFQKEDMYKIFINTLKNIIQGEGMNNKLPLCLDEICDFYKAESCYFYSFKTRQAYCNLQACYDGKILFTDKGIYHEWENFFINNSVLHPQDLSVMPLTKKYTENCGIKGLLASSIKENGEPLGYLYVINPGANQNFDILLISIAPFIATQIEHETNAKKLDYMANTDLLTKVYNRTKYNQKLKEIEKENCPVEIVFVDINGLKAGNDEHGHEYGDAMIKKTAKALSEMFPKQVYRIGGDEFVVLIPNADEKQFENIKKYIKQRWNEDVSVSIGSKWFASSKSIEKKIDEVDKLMYAEKEEYHKTHDRRKRA